MKYKPLDMFLKQTDELKQLIAEHPDYPIVVLCGTEVVGDDSHGFWYAPSLRFELAEILDCEQDINDETVYVDRDEFEEDLRDKLCWKEEYERLPEDAFDKVVKEKLKEFEPYWKPIIAIKADV